MANDVAVTWAWSRAWCSTSSRRAADGGASAIRAARRRQRVDPAIERILLNALLASERGPRGSVAATDSEMTAELL